MWYAFDNFRLYIQLLSTFSPDLTRSRGSLFSKPSCCGDWRLLVAAGEVILGTDLEVSPAPNLDRDCWLWFGLATLNCCCCRCCWELGEYWSDLDKCCWCCTGDCDFGCWCCTGDCDFDCSGGNDCPGRELSDIGLMFVYVTFCKFPPGPRISWKDASSCLVGVCGLGLPLLVLAARWLLNEFLCCCIWLEEWGWARILGRAKIGEASGSGVWFIWL